MLTKPPLLPHAQVTADLHRWIKQSNVRLPAKADKPLIAADALTNSTRVKPVKPAAKADKSSAAIANTWLASALKAAAHAVSLTSETCKRSNSNSSSSRAKILRRKLIRTLTATI